MKSFKTSKKGISLIVLILTIIVMIILATAIILSLNNSGIIGKANKAKTASDTASLKEYVNVLQAEWELMSETERGEYDTSTEYVNAKLEAEGYNQMLNDDGVLLTEGATLAIKAGLKIGDEITGYNDYLTVGKVSPTDGKENDLHEAYESYDDYMRELAGLYAEPGYFAEPNNVVCEKFTTWRYIGTNENGELMIAPDMTDDEMPSLTLSGVGAFSYGPEVLDKVCDELYSTSIGSAESMDTNHVINLLEFTGSLCQYYVYNEGFDLTYPINGYYSFNEISAMGHDCGGLGGHLERYNYFSLVDEDIDLSDVKVNNGINKSNGDLNAERKNLIFFEDSEYWLATRSVYQGDSSGHWLGCDYVSSNYFGCDTFFMSNYMTGASSYYVRPVVSLLGNVTLTSVTANQWSIN